MALGPNHSFPSRIASPALRIGQLIRPETLRAGSRFDRGVSLWGQSADGMNVRLLAIAVFLCAAMGGGAAAQPGDLDERLSAATAARLSGDAAGAVALLRPLAEAAPDNADVQVQLGFALLALGNLAESRGAFDRALALAGDYVDANLGRALIAFREGDLDLAEEEASIVLRARADSEAARIVEQVAASRVAAATPARDRAPVLPDLPSGWSVAAVPRAEESAAVPPLRWRVDLDGTLSDLSASDETWTAASLRIGYAVSDRTTVSAGIEIETRLGATDLRFEGRVDHEVTPTLSAYAYLAGAPDPDFRAEFAYGGGFAWSTEKATHLPLDVLLDLAASHYPDSRSLTLSPGVRVYLADGSASFAVHMINGFNDPGAETIGYSIRGDVEASERVSLYLGYADAPEIDAGQRIEVRTLFGGLSATLTDRLTWRASLSREERSLGHDRTIVSTGFGLRY